jgi:hypothetical protein
MTIFVIETRADRTRATSRLCARFTNLGRRAFNEPEDLLCLCRNKWQSDLLFPSWIYALLELQWQNDVAWFPNAEADRGVDTDIYTIVYRIIALLIAVNGKLLGSKKLTAVNRILVPLLCNYYYYLRFEVFTAVTMKNGVFWDVTPCGSCENRHFGGTKFLWNVVS